LSVVKFFALGGLGEDGKNMYVVDVDQNLFVLDAGLKYPTHELHGVDAILPNYQVLIERKDSVKGLFLSHGHEDHIGAVPRLVRDLNLPVYGTRFTLELVKDAMKDQNMTLSEVQFHEVNSQSVIEFGKVKVHFYQTTHSIPGSISIAVETPDGMVVYAPDFTFNQNVDIMYKTAFDRLSYIASKTVLALLCESLGADVYSTGAAEQNLDFYINQAFINPHQRIVVTAFSTDIYRIQRVVNTALRHDRKIAIIGRKAQRMIDIAINTNVLKIPAESLVALKFLDEKTPVDENMMILVAGDRHEPFHMLQRMINKVDRLVHLNSNDMVLLMTPPVPGTERIAARTLDVLYRHDIPVSKIDKTMLPPAHASRSDIKMLVNMLSPKYFVPVVGEYRHFYQMAQVAEELDYQDRFHIVDNGEVLTWVNGQLKESRVRVEVGETMVDGLMEDDIHNVVLKDREILSQDGALLITCVINPRAKTMLAKPEVMTRGFVYMRENEDLLSEVVALFEKITLEELKNRSLDWRQLKERLRENISRYLYQKTDRRPIVIPILLDATP
jgi:ribonuclease J